VGVLLDKQDGNALVRDPTDHVENQLDSSRSRALSSRNTVEHSCFTCSIGPDDAEDHSWRDIEGKVVLKRPLAQGIDHRRLILPASYLLSERQPRRRPINSEVYSAM